MKRYYQRNLPHWQPAKVVFAITFRLQGSLPKDLVEQLRLERELNSHLWDRADWNNYFFKFDSLLDNPRCGPTWLKIPEVAEIVQEALHYRDGSKYRLIAYCIMSNHVHLIVDKVEGELFRVLQSLKSNTARKINTLLGREGEKVWQRESYDHIIRDYADMCHQVRYLVYNPVTIHLVKTWKAYPYTYLREEFEVYL